MTGAHLSNVRLLAFLTDASSADAAQAVMQKRGGEYRIETGDVSAATTFLASNPSPQTLLVEVPSAEAAPALLDILADKVNPHCKVIVTGKIDTMRFYKWLLDIGIHEYLLQPLTEEQLTAALDKGAVHHATGSNPQLKKLVAVIGARGGAGATTIATNLAAIFAEEQQLTTALIDLDPHFGSAALSLDLEPSRGMRDALEKPDRVDGLFLDRVMISPFAGLSIFAAEEPLQEIMKPQDNAGPLIFTALAEKANIVVADLPRQMNPLTRYALAHADAVIIVAQPQLADLRDVLRIRDYIVEQLKRPVPHLFINGEGRTQELNLGDIAKHYGTAPAARLAHLPEAAEATAQGELLTQQKKLKNALKPLRELAVRISGVEANDTEEEAETSGTSLFAKLKRKSK